MEKRSRRRIRDLENLLASEGLFENESGCARISIMAKSTKALLTGRIQMCKTHPSVAHIGLATHGRSIQIGSQPTMRLRSACGRRLSRRAL